MGDDKIKQSELDMLSAAINRIISSEVLETALSDQLPLTNNLPDSNKIYQGKASILFVDMRESTKLPEKFNTTQLVKIYRSYIRTVVQAIRYSGGVVRDFMGDGVLAVFIDSEEGKSEDRAVYAARYITTAIDKLLNPVLDQAVKHRISCGIGIHTGEVSLSKVGMKGKEQQNNAENEFGIAWIGNSTNLACKFSGAVGNGTIFISASTYSNLSDIHEKQKWEEVELVKGHNTLKGYIAKQYYLPLDNELLPCPAGNTIPSTSLVDELRSEYQKQFTLITKKAEELGRKEMALQEKELQLNATAADLNRKYKGLVSDMLDVERKAYYFHIDVLRSAHCKKEYIEAMGKDFWEDHIAEAIASGQRIGKNEHVVKQEISFAMVDIYQTLELYDKAYDFLVEQATGLSWLHLFTVQDIVPKVGYCDRLETVLYQRLAQNDLTDEQRENFTSIKDWLIFEYKR